MNKNNDLWAVRKRRAAPAGPKIARASISVLLTAEGKIETSLHGGAGGQGMDGPPQRRGRGGAGRVLPAGTGACRHRGPRRPPAAPREAAGHRPPPLRPRLRGHPPERGGVFTFLTPKVSFFCHVNWDPREYQCPLVTASAGKVISTLATGENDQK